MMNSDYTHNILSLAVHRVGNKSEGEGLIATQNSIELGEELKELFKAYFLPPFKSSEHFNLYHESDITLNEVYVYASKIFDKPNTLQEHSLSLAKHLYESSGHPKIKGGEFYTVYFKDCFLGGKKVDAIGLFKTENKDTFLKVDATREGLLIDSEKGININKLDKGCIIYNIDKEYGYVVAIADGTNRGAEAQYWVDNFLHVQQRKDEYFNTQNVLTLCKNFVANELPQRFEVSRADQVDLLNKSVKFFKENDNFNLDDFTKEVMAQPEIIDSFTNFKFNYQKEKDIEIEDNFTISASAVKKQARVFKSVLKLDKNFHIYIHGNRDLIEQGVDENGRKYYKIYFETET